MQNSWISVRRDGNYTFSMVYLHRIKLQETDSFIYPNRTTPNLLYFTDPTGTGANGCVACSNKNSLFADKEQYKVRWELCYTILFG